MREALTSLDISTLQRRPPALEVGKGALGAGARMSDAEAAVLAAAWEAGRAGVQSAPGESPGSGSEVSPGLAPTPAARSLPQVAVPPLDLPTGIAQLVAASATAPLSSARSLTTIQEAARAARFALGGAPIVAMGAVAPYAAAAAAAVAAAVADSGAVGALSPTEAADARAAAADAALRRQEALHAAQGAAAHEELAAAAQARQVAEAVARELGLSALPHTHVASPQDSYRSLYDAQAAAAAAAAAAASARDVMARPAAPAPAPPVPIKLDAQGRALGPAASGMAARSAQQSAPRFELPGEAVWLAASQAATRAAAERSARSAVAGAALAAATKQEAAEKAAKEATKRAAEAAAAAAPTAPPGAVSAAAVAAVRAATAVEAQARAAAKAAETRAKKAKASAEAKPKPKEWGPRESAAAAAAMRLGAAKALKAVSGLRAPSGAADPSRRRGRACGVEPSTAAAAAAVRIGRRAAEEAAKAAGDLAPLSDMLDAAAAAVLVSELPAEAQPGVHAAAAAAVPAARVVVPPLRLPGITASPPRYGASSYARALIVSSRAPWAAELAASTRDDTAVIAFDWAVASAADVVASLHSTLCGARVASVGLATHAKSAALGLTSGFRATTSSLRGRQEVRAAWTALGGAVVRGGRMEVLAPGLGGSGAEDDAAALLAVLREVTGTEVAVSPLGASAEAGRYFRPAPYAEWLRKLTPPAESVEAEDVAPELTPKTRAAELAEPLGVALAPAEQTSAGGQAEAPSATEEHVQPDPGSSSNVLREMDRLAEELGNELALRAESDKRLAALQADLTRLRAAAPAAAVSPSPSVASSGEIVARAVAEDLVAAAVAEAAAQNPAARGE